MGSEQMESSLKRKITQLESAKVSHACTMHRRRLKYLVKISGPVNATLAARSMCMLLLILNRFATVVARIWLKRQYNAEELNHSYTDEDWCVLIETWFVEAPAVDLGKLPDYNTRSGLAMYTKAAQFTTEYRIEQWVLIAMKRRASRLHRTTLSVDSK
jgi:hypothetical protein